MPARALKEIFKGAATTMITQSGKHDLYAAYERMTESGIKSNLVTENHTWNAAVTTSGAFDHAVPALFP